MSQKASQDKTEWPFLLMKSTHADGRYSESDDHRVKLSLRFRTYGLLGQSERETAEEGGRGEVVEVVDGWSQEPRLSKQCEQSRSVPRVSDPHYLLHTGLVILQCGSSLP